MMLTPTIEANDNAKPQNLILAHAILTLLLSTGFVFSEGDASSGDPQICLLEPVAAERGLGLANAR